MTSFSYFDQFTEVEVNFSGYIKDISDKNNYQYTFNNIQPIKVKLLNIFEHISILEKFKQNILNFDPYVIKDYDRIETVSFDKYGSIDYWWVIAIVNDMKNLFTDWPLTESQLAELSQRMFTKEGKYNKQTYYNLLFERNEKKRNVFLPKTSVVNDIVTKFRYQFEKSQLDG